MSNSNPSSAECSEARHPKPGRLFPLLLLIPLAMSIAALATHQLFFKLGEPAACALILSAYVVLAGARHTGYILAALVWSMIGDYFLCHRTGHPHYFVYGIAAFFVAHLGYLVYALKNGRIHLKALFALLAVYVPFFGYCLNPGIQDNTLRLASFLYLLVSCLSMSAACGLRLAWIPKLVYILGIALILFSDTIIAWSEFMHYRDWNWLILPTYYLAHMCVTLALIWHSPAPHQPGHS